MKRVLGVLYFILISASVFPQSHSVIDSLQIAFRNEKDKKAQGAIVYELLHEYLRLSEDSANAFIDRMFRIIGDKDKKSLRMMYYYMGGAYLDFKMYAAAISAYNKQLVLSRESGDKRDEAYGLVDIGNVYYTQNFYPEATENYLKSLNLFQEISDTFGLVRSLMNVANIYSITGDHQKELEYNLKALDYLKLIGKERLDIRFGKGEIARCFFEISGTYSSLKNYLKSLEYLHKSEKIFDSINNIEMLGECYNNIGEVYFQQSNYQKALEYYLKAVVAAKRVGFKEGISCYFSNIGATYNKLKQFNKSLKYSEESYQIAKQERSKEMLKNAAENLTNAYEGLGDFQSAFKYYRIFNAYSDSLNIDENKQKIIQVEMKNEFSSELKAQELIQKQKDEKVKTEIRQQKLVRNFAVGGIILLIFGLSFVIRSYYIKKKSNILLAAQKKEIEDKKVILQQQKEHIEMIHHEVSQSIDYAKRIQSSIFPDESLLDKYLSDHFIMLQPRDRVSGDFYWWADIEDSLIVAVADCTGHGVPGAFMSMLGVSFLREIVNKEYIIQPDVILRKLRKEIMTTLKQEGRAGEQKDGMDIALISINLNNNFLQFSGANNPLYIIRNDNLIEIKADKMPISIYEKMDKFNLNEFQLIKGDNLYLFSDGFADQFGGEFCKKFKYKPFQDLLISIAGKTMNEQKKSLESAFFSWKNTIEQTDDVLIVGLKV